MGEGENSSNHNEDENYEDAIERILRLSTLRVEVEKAGGQTLFEGPLEDASLEELELYWQHVLSFQAAELAPMLQVLAEKVQFVPPDLDSLHDDLALSVALWDLIEALAELRVFLYGTDVFSDRELYQLLVEEILIEDFEIMPEGANWNCHLNVSESDGDRPARFDRDRFLPSVDLP